MLEIKNLNISFKNKSVLHQLNLSVEQGSVFGILGKNGAGKTTLFEGLYQSLPYSGEILWNEKSLKRENIGYLETENYFYPYITGEEYLGYFRGKDKMEAVKMAEQFRLPLKKFVQNYSHGMKKKLALVGLLQLNHPINILDEPFNGVDFEGVQQLYEVIRNLKNESKIIIISSHIIETLFHTCDKIGILENGRITQIYPKENFDELKDYKG
ncbi:MAG: ATP-binding cassette domain-containing protein [Cruoricaptor ignavus]|nr:ATP-binding cassette domain-containing protein [Cruoricaptor ignavus]